MLDFLKNANISDATISYINNNFSSNDIIALSDNSDECLKIISYFRKIGLTRIEDLLINETYIFLKLYNRLIDKLSKYDIVSLVNDVNEDYTCIEKYM